MYIKSILTFLFCCASLICTSVPQCQAGDKRAWLISYVGNITSNTLHEMLYSEWDFRKGYMLALGGGYRFYQHKDLFALEGEILGAGHWGDNSEASYLEGGATINLRWLKFPWNGHVYTTFALGDGLSCTSSIPNHEEEFHSEQSSRFLNLLIFEVSAAPSESSNWDIFLRLHHRSGIFGLFNGAHGASNIPCIGFRYYFSLPRCFK